MNPGINYRHSPQRLLQHRRLPGILLSWMLLLLLPVCAWSQTKKMNRRVTLWRNDKIPYGTYVAYNNLSDLFPNADITINKVSPAEVGSKLRTASWEKSGNSRKACIIIANTIDPDEQDLNALMNFVGEGNHIFMSAINFGDSLLKKLDIRRSYTRYDEDSMRVSVINPVSGDSISYFYPGRRIDGWADSLDPKYISVIGRDREGRPDFLRLTYKGGGSILINMAPLAFSNFFLLYDKNMSYYNNALSWLPESCHEVIWDDYFRYGREDFSALHYILNAPGAGGNYPLRWAFWLLLILFAIIYLFESKRKQRPVPIITGLRNASLEFVQTIGRLYFQRKDNHNLALKMQAHFMDHIRTRYNLTATTLDPETVSRLAFRTGMPQEELQALAEEMERIREQSSVTDEQLMGFNSRLENVYQQG